MYYYLTEVDDVDAAHEADDGDDEVRMMGDDSQLMMTVFVVDLESL